MSFLEQLVSQGIIADNQILEVMRRAEQKFGGSVEDALTDIGVAEDKVLEAKSKYFNIPSKKLNLKAISFEILKYIPEDSAKHYQFVPIGMVDGVLEVGVLDPENIGGMDALQFISAKLNVPYKIFIISRSDFNSVLGNYKGLGGEVDSALTDLDVAVEEANKESSDDKKELEKAVKSSGKKEETIVEDAPIIKIVGVIIRHATEGNASDIHIENEGDKVKVRFRVDGILHTSIILPINVYNGVVARIKILAKMRLDEKRKPQDGGFSVTIEGRKIDFRVSTFPAYYGEKVVMRILDSEKGVKPLDKLNLSPRNMAMIREAISRPYGLILITGPTGAGKSTTLYSMINELDKEKSNVVSLEDPVEYHIPDMNQSQVMPEIGYTFASGLRSILRQDPDIIMVGEIRDKETAQLAIQAALTGHLVFSTLHTNSAIGAVPRLIDMGVDPYLIAPTLILSIAQRLARVVCEDSRKEVPMDEATRVMLSKEFQDIPEEFKKEVETGDKMYEVVPSQDCPSGLRGRMAIFEMFKVDKEMQSVILKNPIESELYRVARSKGMLTMKEDAILKSLKGMLPFQEIYRDL